MMKYIIVIWTLFAVLLTGCANKKDDIVAVSTQSTIATEIVDDTDMVIDLSQQECRVSAGAVILGDRCFTITRAGTYHIFGSMVEGRIVVDAPADADIQLILEGVNLSYQGYAPLYIKQSGIITITLAEGTQNILENTGDFLALDENNVDAVIFSKEDLVFNGVGSLEVTSEKGNGITGKDSVTICGGTLFVTASGHAVEAKDALTLENGNLVISAGKDGVHVKNDDDVSLGIFTMNGGSVFARTEGNAIRAGASLTVNGGNITATQCDEGLEAAKVFINDGELFIQSADDGINATIGSGIDCYNGEALICISGGKVEIIATGDGLDSNGDIVVNGGEVLIHGPGRIEYGCGALDYVNTAQINGGRFIAFTSVGKSFSDSSKQASFHLNLSELVEPSTVTLTDSAQSVLFSKEVHLPLNSIVVSIPELQVGSNYAVTIDDEVIPVHLSQTITKTKGMQDRNGVTYAENDESLESFSNEISDNNQESVSTDPTVTAEQASSMERYEYNGLKYWLYIPQNQGDNKPLIVYLHGGSGKGSDLKLLTNVDGFPQYVQNGTIAPDAYVLFPQCPASEKGWASLTDSLESLIDYVCDTYPVNRGNISLTGHSMGGTGTWSLAIAKPWIFRKIAPMSGSVRMTEQNIEALSKLSVWACVGNLDTIVSPDASIEMVEALQRAGAEATITVLNDCDHSQVPSRAYLGEQVIAWLIS